MSATAKSGCVARACSSFSIADVPRHRELVGSVRCRFRGIQSDS